MRCAESVCCLVSSSPADTNRFVGYILSHHDNDLKSGQTKKNNCLASFALSAGFCLDLFLSAVGVQDAGRTARLFFQAGWAKLCSPLGLHSALPFASMCC